MRATLDDVTDQGRCDALPAVIRVYVVADFRGVAKGLAPWTVFTQAGPAQDLAFRFRDQDRVPASRVPVEPCAALIRGDRGQVRRRVFRDRSVVDLVDRVEVGKLGESDR